MGAIAAAAQWRRRDQGGMRDRWRSFTRALDMSASMTSKSAELEGECDELFELEPITVIEKLCKS